MKRLKYFVFSLLILYVFAGLADHYYYRWIKTTALFSGEVQEWNRVEEGQINTDIAVFGSSRAFIHIDPELLSKKLNQSVYNLGLNGSKFKMQYYRFDEYLIHNPKPKMIVWNLDTFSFSKIKQVFQSNQYVPFMLWNFKLYRYLKDYQDTNFLDFVLPFYRYRDQKYWNSEHEKAEKEKLNADQMFRSKGFKSYNRAWKVDWDKLKYKKVDFDEESYQLLEKLIVRCQKENIKLVFTIAPEFYKGQKYMLNRAEIISRYQTILAKYNLPLLDYSTNEMSYDQDLFYNTTHMNMKGAKKFSIELAEDLERINK